ncbi:MAG: hypothetical protein KBA86_00745, partial [Bacteroidales bacterium]|nr:hypothetical protein [Bacteroidales bacterium]
NSYKSTLSQYALQPSLPIWEGKGGVIWGDLEVCSLKTMMFEKYPSISPYTYCANNPVMFVDPTEETVFIVGDDGQRTPYDPNTTYSGKDPFTAEVYNALATTNKSSEGKAMVDELVGSSNEFTIVRSNGLSDFKESNKDKAYANVIKTDPDSKLRYEALQQKGVDISGGSGGTISWNSKGYNIVTTHGLENNPTMHLVHELSHASDANSGSMNTYIKDGLEMNEWQACYKTNIIRGQLQLPFQSYYGGEWDYNWNKPNPQKGTYLLDNKGKPYIPK